ncbi:MAG: hypothetical protein J1E38_03040 [Paramuribaculum sp.]|nr:hypothetical protein [Paramuribaculum sp.]
MKRNILGWLGSAALGVATLIGFAGCTDDMGWSGNTDLGDKVHGTLSVPLGTSSPTEKSRSVDFSQNAMVKIDSYWIGVFDNITGELLGTKYDEHPRKTDGTRWTLNNNSDTPFKVDDIDIYYYEKNPYAHIVGVVNFNDVLAKKVGEEEATTPLLDYLKDVKKFTDIKDLVIDTKSADKANRDRGSDEANPIMMGFYSTARTSIHTQINPDGSLYVSNRSTPLDENYEFVDEIKANLTGSGADLHLEAGSIRLQRLLSEVNVYVLPTYDYEDGWDSNGYYHEDYNSSSIRSVRYKVVNKPMEVFLMEHATDQDAYSRTSEADYLKYTANSADFTGKFEDDDWKYADYFYDSQLGMSGYRLTYQHYENKHWGKDWWHGPEYQSNKTPHFWREKRYVDDANETGLSDIYRTLCPSIDEDWNNNASYIVLEVTFSDYKETQYYDNDYNKWNGYRNEDATVYYIIHEGQTSWQDGSSAASILGYDSPVVMDYQTQRNTQYHYMVRIGGADGLIMNVSANEFDEPQNHNDGIYGNGNYQSVFQLENTNEPIYYELGIPTNEQRHNLKWIYGQITPSGSSSYNSQYWGSWTSDDGSLKYNNFYDDVTGRTYYFYQYNIQDPNNINQDLMNGVFVTKGKYGPYDPTKPVGMMITLQTFIDLPDDASFLQLKDDEMFYLCFMPYYVTGEGENYDRLQQYIRMFSLIQPAVEDKDGCAMLYNTIQFVQHAYDNRMYIYDFYANYDHDNCYSSYSDKYVFGHVHNRDYFDNNTFWCGAPGTVSWFYIRQEYWYDDNSREIPDYQIKIGNQTFTVNHEDILLSYRNSSYDYLLLPVYIPTNYSNSYYGYLDVEITMKPNAAKYKPSSNTTTKKYEKGFWMQRKQNSGSGRWQWLFANVSESTFGYSQIWDFYNHDNNHYANVEFGGLTVICNKSDRAITTVKKPLWGQKGDDGQQDYESLFDCLNFAGGYGSSGTAPSRNQDAMLMKFWVDRPGDIYLSYGYEKEGNNREWRAFWRSADGTTKSPTYLKWTPDPTKFNTIIPEEKGVVNQGEMEDFWPEVDNNTGRFVNGPVEVLIYMASSSGYIRSIEFRPN